MSARERILSAIRAAKPDPLPPPELSIDIMPIEHPVEAYAELAAQCKATVVRVGSDEEIVSDFTTRFPDAETTWSILSPEPALDDPHGYENLDVLLARAEFGVAENAALWMNPEGYPAHAALVLCQHLAVIISADAILPTLHEAYARFGDQGLPLFGTFIAGPSKTADIEQSLVLGAHGARSLTVYLVENG